MKIVLSFALLAVRIFIIFKVASLLYYTHSQPENYPLDSLNWWVYYLVFDIWLTTSFKDLVKNEED